MLHFFPIATCITDIVNRTVRRIRQYKMAQIILPVSVGHTVLNSPLQKTYYFEMLGGAHQILT